LRQNTKHQHTTPTDSHDYAIEVCRLDVWLYRTRMLKTRRLATQFIQKGKVRVTRNGQTVRVKKPHHLIKTGQSVTFMRGRELITIEMIAAGTRRGPAPEAQRLYHLLTSEATGVKSPLS